jgi:hypothetical protein
MTVIRSFKYFAGNEWLYSSNGNFLNVKTLLLERFLAKIPDCRDKDDNTAAIKSKKFLTAEKLTNFEV